MRNFFNIKVIIAALCFVIISFKVCFCSAEREANYFANELDPLISSLIEAVLEKRLDILAQYVPNSDPAFNNDKFPDNTLRFLYDTKYLQKHYYKGMKSVIDILTPISCIKVKYERIQYEKTHPYNDKIVVRAYFYNPKIIQLKLPLSEVQKELWMVDYASILFVKSNSKWFTPTLFESETEGPL